jgi:hypothetical protein
MDESSCTSPGCHNISVHGGYHPMDVEIYNSKKRMEISKNLPLVNGKIGCTTCHNPKLQTKESGFLRKKNPFFIRGVYEHLLNKKKEKEKNADVSVGGSPKINGLTAGPGSIGGAGGPGDAKADKKRAKTAGKKAGFLQVRWGRYQICYRCHTKDEYKRFSPHRHQLDKKGNINRDICLICHSRIPDRESIDDSNFFLVRSIETMCRNCHSGYETSHPAKTNHFGKKADNDLANRARKAMGALATLIPLNKNKLVCPSCHNSHAPGVILAPIAAKGAGEDAGLRMSGQMRCGLCHGAAKRSRGKGKQYSPF